MAFPTSPTNGQQTTQNGIIYTYNSTLTVWALTTSTTGSISATAVTATANIQGGNLITTGTVNAATHTGTLVSVAGNITGGNITTGGIGSFTGSYMVIPVSTGSFEGSVSTVGAFYYNTSFGALRIRLSGGWTTL